MCDQIVSVNNGLDRTGQVRTSHVQSRPGRTGPNQIVDTHLGGVGPVPFTDKMDEAALTFVGCDSYFVA